MSQWGNWGNPVLPCYIIGSDFAIWPRKVGMKKHEKPMTVKGVHQEQGSNQSQIGLSQDISMIEPSTIRDWGFWKWTMDMGLPRMPYLMAILVGKRVRYFWTHPNTPTFFERRTVPNAKNEWDEQATISTIKNLAVTSSNIKKYHTPGKFAAHGWSKLGVSWAEGLVMQPCLNLGGHWRKQSPLG